MDKLREEFIRAIMISLKIEENPFIISTIDEYTKQINTSDYKDFMTSLFGTQHSYLNSLDRIAKVSEQFKPIITDKIELKAKELVLWVEALNTQIGDDAKRTGDDFVKLVNRISLKDMGADDNLIAVLDEVRSGISHKQLIINIRVGWNSKEQLDAFKRAIEKVKNNTNQEAITNSKIRKMIKG